MAQWASCLPCKLENLDSRMYIKVRYNSACTCNSRKVKEEAWKAIGQLYWCMQQWEDQVSDNVDNED